MSDCESWSLAPYCPHKSWSPGYENKYVKKKIDRIIFTSDSFWSRLAQKGTHIKLFIFPCMFLTSDFASDTITVPHHIQEPNTLSSNNTKVELGYFNPQNSTNFYVGIWYLSKTVVV